MNLQECAPPCPVCKISHSNAPQPRIGQKCGICGSTAIDHTEMHCQINRLSLGAPSSTKGKVDETIQK